MLTKSDDTVSDEDKWRENMIKKRMIEFWTGDPSTNPPPSTEERIRILAHRRASDPHFTTRLSAYNLPLDFTDEQILNWD